MAASGFDGLLERVIYEVALAGIGGLGIKELGDAVRGYYADPLNSNGSEQQPAADEDLFFSEKPPDAGPVVDDDFVELVWQWVSRHPEVTVEDGSRSADNNEAATESDAEHKFDKYRDKRLCTGEDRVWYAIAGHGIDYKRIPPLEFQALSVVAAHGTKGLLQPDVTKLTGQDKRSLPKRTDNLAKNGYIVKTTVIARGTKTSLLKLKKFAGDSDVPEDQAARPGTVIIQYNLWFDEVMRLLKENDNIMAFEDIRIGLGINGKKFQTRALHRCVRRLANVGCLRKVTARVEAPESQPDADMKSVRSLQLLRQPTAIDRIAFMRSDWRKSKLLDPAQQAYYAAQAANDDDDEDDEDAEAVAGLDGEAEDPKRIKNRVPPLWNPDLPFANYMYNRISEAGIAGTSSSELYDDAVGQFWKRAMDEMLAKLSDLWQFSQPPHLRHLSIVKDVGQSLKQPTFLYRTHDNFEKAVEIGDAYWESIYGPEEKGKGKAGKKKAETAASAQPDLDNWGFPKLNPKLFVGQNGAATLDECRRGAKPVVHNVGSLLTPAYKGARGSKTTNSPASGTGLSKKLQTTQSTPSRLAQRATASASRKRTADTAELDDDDEAETPGEATPAADKRVTKSGMGAARRKSVRVDKLPDAPSPDVPASSPGRLLDGFMDEPMESDNTPLPKKRGRPSKAMLAERASARKKAKSALHTEEELVETPAQLPQETPSQPPPQLVPDDDEVEQYDPTSIHDDTDEPMDANEMAPVVDVEPGVTIDPPGAWTLKKLTVPSRGRPKKAKIAVFRSSRLRNFPWYVRQPTHAPPKTPKRTPKIKQTLEQLETPARSPTPIAEDGNVGLLKSPQILPADRDNASAGNSLPHATGTAAKEPLHAISNKHKESTNDAPGDDDQATAGADRPNQSIDVDREAGTNGHPAGQVDDGLPDMTVDTINEQDEPSRTTKKSGFPKGNTGLHFKRSKVAMDIISSCGGVFPGRGEIWYPYATVWQREYTHTPDKNTVENVIKGLIGFGKIKKLTFFFKSKKGLTVERSILVAPDVDPNSPKVKLLQKKIIETYPAIVVPEEADVSPELRQQLARNPQVAQNAKAAKAAMGDPSTPGAAQEAGPKQLPPHYIRDEFPRDLNLTVKRTANGSGLGVIDAQLQSIKRSRKIASFKRRGGRPRKIPIDADMTIAEEELTYEQALLQSHHEFSSYGQGGLSKRSAANSRAGRMRGSGPGARKLPGRILGSKKGRKASNAAQAAGTQTKQSLPWNAIGYVASQAAHSVVEPNWMATTTRTRTVPKRISGIQWQWVDPSSLADWQVDATAPVSDDEAMEYHENEASTFGLLLPTDAQVVDSNGLTQNADVQIAPRTIGDIVNSHMLPTSPDTDSSQNEATKFFNEVERVQAWEKRVVKANQALARGTEHPFINYTTPAVVSLPREHVSPTETPSTRTGKRVRIDDEEGSPQSKRKRQTRAKAQPKALADNEPRTYRKRDRRAAANFSDSAFDRLARAVALVSVVAGGISYRRNWFIVAHALSYEYESEFLRHRWDKVRDQRDALVKQMQAQIWEPFLEAYERGALPRVDFDNLENTDWPALMEWVETEVLTTTSVTDFTKPAAIVNKVPELPLTSEELRTNFEVTRPTANIDVGRDEFFTAVIDKRRKDVAVNSLNGIPLEPVNQDQPDQEYNELLRSWTRAVVLTDDKSYNSSEAYAKITKFGDKILDSTIRDLVAEKILQVRKKGRTLPGRNLKLDETAFLTMFRRWSEKLGPEHTYLTRVAKKRAEVLEVLRHQDHLDLAYHAEDELYVVLTAMVGQGLLTVKSNLPERNDDFDAPFPKLSAWGYSGFNYNVRTFDKTRLRFSIVYEKTDKFTFEHGLKGDIPVPTVPPQFPGEAGHRLPVWMDIHEQLLPRMWEMAFRSVLNLVVFRPGIGARQMEEAHKGKIWAWEIELVMQWMEQTGVAERTGPGEEVGGVWKGGWKASEWWYCALCPDVAKWPALGE